MMGRPHLHWSAGYMGLPWRLGGRARDGLDCYGLARLVLLERAGIDVDASAAPAVADLANPAATAHAADRIAAAAPWVRVAPGDVRELDVAVCRSPRLGRHVGIVVAADRHPRMLHADAPGGSTLARLDAMPWRSTLIGYVRHQALCDNFPPQNRGEKSTLEEGAGLDLCAAVRVTVAAGASIATMAAELLPAATPGERAALVRVTVDGACCLPAEWALCPPAGAIVTLTVVPAGGLRSILQVVVAISAMLIAPYLGPVVAGALSITGAGVGITTSLIAAGIMVTGNLLLNALIPPPDDDSTTSPTYGVTGWRNVENPDGPIPVVLGRHRQAPVIAASAYTEAVGDDQYLRSLLTCGIGPALIESLRIGETPITDFAGVTTELRQGYPGDGPITLVTRQVVEEQLSIYLEQEGGILEPQKRRTQADISAYEVVLTAPGGLGRHDKNGKTHLWSVQCRLRHRLWGETEWSFETMLTLAGATQKTVRGSWHFDVSPRGRYEVEITRFTVSTDASEWTDDVAWTALRSLRPEAPIAVDLDLALIAVRIKASKQLNGTLDELSADVSCICPDWDAATSTWITRATRNPASLLRYVVQGPACARPRGDDEIDLAALEDWHEFCALKGLSYDRVHDYEAREDEVLTAVAAAGRAAWRDDGERLTVIIDRPRTVVDGVLNARTARNFRWRQTYAEPPDAIRVSFFDSGDDYAKGEMVVPWPGFAGDPQRFETWTGFEGITGTIQLWRAIRRRQLEIEHRPATYTCDQELEHLHLARGDLVLLSHPVLDSIMAAAVVKAAVGDLVQLDRRITMEEAGAYAIRVVAGDGTASISTVTTHAGDWDILEIASGPVPAAGSLVMFGAAGEEVVEAIVRRIERAGGGLATLTCVDHAPQIDAILDATPVPAYSGRVGTAVPADTTPPDAPTLTVVSSQAAGGMGEDGMPLVRIKVLRSGPVEVASYVIEHRLAGAGSWTAATVDAGTGVLVTGGYAGGATIEVRAHSVSIAGIPGATSAAVTHVIGTGDAVTTPDRVTDLTGALVAGVPRIGWTAPDTVVFAAARVWRAASAAGFAAAVDVSGALAGPPAATRTFDDTGADPGAWDYYVTAEEATGARRSDPAGPVTLTVEADEP